MKKILILTYHFPPMNVIASQRALGYANHFKKFGFEPTIVTFDWSKPVENQYCLPSEIGRKIILEENEKYKVYRLPILRHKRARILNWFHKRPFLNKIGILSAWLFGHLDTTSILLDHKLTERKFLKKHLQNNNYDVMMGIFSPHFHLSNCKWAFKKFGIKYALDYRDLWSNHLTIKDFEVDAIMKFKIKIFNFYWRKWNRHSLLQSITSDPWLNKLNETTGKEGVVITNGFEKEAMKVEKSDLLNPNIFTITHTGTIYPEQEFEFLLKGLKMFFEDHESVICKVLFVGLNFAGLTQRNGTLISKYLKPNQYQITERIPREKVIFIQQNSNLLLFPTTLVIPGTYSGKIFEYINSGVEILAGPKDVGAVSDLLQATKVGHVCGSEEQVSQFIFDRYIRWKKGQGIKVETNTDSINYYSREIQTGKLAGFIDRKL